MSSEPEFLVTIKYIRIAGPGSYIASYEFQVKVPRYKLGVVDAGFPVNVGGCTLYLKVSHVLVC